MAKLKKVNEKLDSIDDDIKYLINITLEDRPKQVVMDTLEKRVSDYMRRLAEMEDQHTIVDLLKDKVKVLEETNTRLQDRIAELEIRTLDGDG